MNALLLNLSSIESFNKMTLAYITNFICQNLDELSTSWVNSDTSQSLFSLLNNECDIDYFWEHLENIDQDLYLKIIDGWSNLPIEQQEMHTEPAFSMYKENSENYDYTYNDMQRYVIGRAYRNYLKALLAIYINDLELLAQSEHTKKTKDDFLALLSSQIAKLNKVE